MTDAPEPALLRAHETAGHAPTGSARTGGHAHHPAEARHRHSHAHARPAAGAAAPVWPSSVLLRLGLAQRLLVALAVSLLVWLLIASVLS